MESYEWKNDPVFKSMSPEKYQFLVEIIEEASKQDQKQIGTFFRSAMLRANAAGITLSNEETALLLRTMLPHMSPAEQKRVQMIRMMMGNLNKKK